MVLAFEMAVPNFLLPILFLKQIYKCTYWSELVGKIWQFLFSILKIFQK